MKKHIVHAIALSSALTLLGAGCTSTSSAPVESPKKTVTSTQEKQEKTSASKIYLTSTLDGVPWTANVSNQGALYYPKGLKVLKIEQPYLQLAFPASAQPDTRSLVISIKGFEPNKGKYTGEMEVVLSGSSTGKDEDNQMQGYQDDLPAQKTNFTFEITDWIVKNDKQALLSAKFQGDLKGIFGAKDVTFKDGIIKDLPVTIYDIAY